LPGQFLSVRQGRQRKLRPDLIVTDIKMPGKSGLEMAAQVHQLLPQCRFIITTAYETSNLRARQSSSAPSILF